MSQIYPLELFNDIVQAVLKPNSCVRVNLIKTFGLLYNATHAVGSRLCESGSKIHSARCAHELIPVATLLWVDFDQEVR